MPHAQVGFVFIIDDSVDSQWPRAGGAFSGPCDSESGSLLLSSKCDDVACDDLTGGGAVPPEGSANAASFSHKVSSCRDVN